MTLWRRVSDGVALCLVVVLAAGAAELLVQADLPILRGIGGMLGVVVYAFGFIVLLAGLVMIVVGTVAHRRAGRGKQSPDA